MNDKNRIPDDALRFWKEAAIGFLPLRPAESFRAGGFSTTQLSSKLDKEVIEAESGSMDEELAMLDDL